MTRRGFLLVLSAASLASAGPSVIEAGREREVLALVAPYELGREVTAGWKLWNVKIERTEIVLELTAGPNEHARVTLSERAGGQEHSASFDIRRDPNAATAALASAIRANDRGGFWHAPPKRPATAAKHATRAHWWPAGVALAVIAAMLWVARARPRE
ncbi:MAG: hypothetical protein HYZ29_26580 [Myxococcales bacterium]|nr:hypothetical protein [Myxococcales bacterium]